MNRKLEESEERYRNFVEQSSEGIWLLEFDGPIPTTLPPEEQVRRIQKHGYVAECNDTLARMYGYRSGREMIGTRLIDLYGGEADERNFQSTLKLVESGYRGDNRETQEFTSRGERVYFLNNAAGIIRDQHLVGIWGTQRDITDLKQAEAEQEALVEELETKNAELERFTYTVSHDLKSPLITIQGFLGYLEQDAQAGNTDRMNADISRISSATQKMQQLLDELLELSRIGRIVSPVEEISLHELAHEAVGNVAGRLVEHRVAVRIAPDLPVVHGDRPRLREVLENLVDNAVKFMGDQPEPQVEIGVRRDGEETVITVQDNGVGIDPLYQEKVFGLFEKLNVESEGSGVGLAIVQRIIELHNGRIWIESEGSGQGSTFCFTLPLRSQSMSKDP